MGITSYTQRSTQIKYDPLLSWPVPSTWSLKDAATVPLSYAMVTRVLTTHKNLSLITLITFFFTAVLLHV